MSRLKFSPDNVKKNPFNFPKLKLEKKGDKARIVLLEDPEYGWVHNLQKPKIEDGVALTVQKTAFKTGKNYTDYVYQWISTSMCLGDEDALAENGSDPANCPMCAEAKESDRVKAPKRRFAMHVFQYNTKPGKTDVATPFGGQTVIWTFTDKVFEKLAGYIEELGDLRQHDLLLVSDNPAFNGFEISPSMKAEWMADKERAEITKTTFKENQAEDLSIFVGNTKEKKYIEMDLEEIRVAWRVALGAPKPTGETATSLVGAVTLEEGIDSLLDADKSDEPYEEIAPEAAEEAPVKKKAKKEEEESAPEADNFDDLLAGL